MKHHESLRSRRELKEAVISYRPQNDPLAYCARYLPLVGLNMTPSGIAKLILNTVRANNSFGKTFVNVDPTCCSNAKFCDCVVTEGINLVVSYNRGAGSRKAYSVYTVGFHDGVDVDAVVTEARICVENCSMRCAKRVITGLLSDLYYYHTPAGRKTIDLEKFVN